MSYKLIELNIMIIEDKSIITILHNPIFMTVNVLYHSAFKI